MLTAECELQPLHDLDPDYIREQIIELILEETSTLRLIYKQEAKLITKEIRKCNEDPVEFANALVKVYTGNDFLHRRLNNLLRNENWKELRNLAPYLLQLLKILTVKDDSWKGESVYRGSSLSEQDLLVYDPSINKYFSWNSFTSTSRKMEAAQRFIQDMKGNLPVLFTIYWRNQLDSFALPSTKDIAKMSRMPYEEEVLFAPGALFEVKKKVLINGVCHIYLEHLSYTSANISNLGYKGLVFEQEIAYEKFKIALKEKPKLITIEHITERHAVEICDDLRQSKFINTLILRKSDPCVAQNLAEVFSKLYNITYLCIGHEASIKGMDSFIGSLHLTAITSLHMYIGTFACLEALMTMLPKSKITYLDITLIHDPTTHIDKPAPTTVKMLNKFLRVLPKSNVNSLRLRNINSKVTSALADILPNTRITSLRLENHQFQKNGFDSLAKVLPRTDVRLLEYFSGSEEMKIKKFIEILPKTKIQYLDFSGNNFSNEETIELLKTISKGQIKILDFTPCKKRQDDISNMRSEISFILRTYVSQDIELYCYLGSDAGLLHEKVKNSRYQQGTEKRIDIPLFPYRSLDAEVASLEFYEVLELNNERLAARYFYKALGLDRNGLHERGIAEKELNRVFGI